LLFVIEAPLEFSFSCLRSLPLSEPARTEHMHFLVRKLWYPNLFGSDFVSIGN
jgi:hypothetical protein